VAAAAAATPEAPAGFTSLFNVRPSGWHGMPHEDPYKLAAMPKADRKTHLDDWSAEAKQHWSVDHGELVNDGKGPI